MIFGVADNGDANAEALRNGALGDSFGSVVGALGVNVGAQFFEQRFRVRLGEDKDEIHVAKGGNQASAVLFVEDGTTGSLEGRHSGIGVNGNDEDVPFAFGTGKIANVADVQSVKTAVGQDHTVALAAQIGDGCANGLTGLNFGLGGPHKS